MLNPATAVRNDRASILVVEDDYVVAGDIEDSLKLMGYDVMGTAASAEDCLRQAIERRPDLVLMDIRIVGSMDGIETAKALRIRLDVPVVYLTAYADERTVARARETEPQGYILKPFRFGELKSVIEIALFKHAAESQLRSRERWISTTLRAMGDAVIAVDGSAKVTLMNRAAEDLTDTTEARAKGRNVREVLPLIDERTRAPLEHPVVTALTERRPVALPPHTAVATKNGELPIDDSVAPILDDAGNVSGAVIVCRDVSEQRKLQEKMALTDRMASLGVLAAGVAHEINNPLTYVLSNADLAREQIVQVRDALARVAATSGADPGPWHRSLAEVEEWLGEIHLGAERIRRIVNDLRVFGRPDDGEESGDVVAAIEWALRVSDAQIAQRAQLVRELRPVPRVRGSDARLGQVFLNLVLNAIYAVPEGDPGTHTIFVSTHKDEKGDVIALVRDTGAGMPPDVVKRIFEPFFTTKPTGSGTGLGLSICHRIVTAIGGELTVESAMGRGSAFKVRLPALQTAPPSVRPVRAPATGRCGRVLLIDDDDLVAGAMARMLRPHEVVKVGSGSDALERLKEDQSFDVLFCDLMMPGMTGMDLHKALAASEPELARRMGFMTGGAFSDRARDFLESVRNVRVVKPVRAQELKDLVETFLREHPRKPS